MTKKTIKPTQEELEMENAIIDWTFKSVENLDEWKNMMQKAVKETTKKKNIHLSISNNVLQKIKVKAYQNGLPYQTFINSILHKYVNS